MIPSVCSSPARSSRRITGLTLIPFSRRLAKPDGSFDGVVVGSMRLDYFEQIFKAIALGPGATVTLARSDGIVLVRSPADSDFIERDRNPGRIIDLFSEDAGRPVRNDLDRRWDPQAVQLQPGRRLPAGGRDRTDDPGYLRPVAAAGLRDRRADRSARGVDHRARRVPEPESQAAGACRSRTRGAGDDRSLDGACQPPLVQRRAGPAMARSPREPQRRWRC